MAVEILNCDQDLFKRPRKSGRVLCRQLKSFKFKITFSENNDFIPNANLIPSIVRKGSLQMVRRGLCQDVQDSKMIKKLKSITSRSELLSLCHNHNDTTPIIRNWKRYVEIKDNPQFYLSYLLEVQSHPPSPRSVFCSGMSCPKVLAPALTSLSTAAHRLWTGT